MLISSKMVPVALLAVAMTLMLIAALQMVWADEVSEETERSTGADVDPRDPCFADPDLPEC